MKKSNYIADKVFNVNLNYVKLQNKTKELFFRCLDEERDIDYFKTELEKIWDNIDYSYFQDELAEYEAIISEKTLEGKTTENIPKGQYGSLFALAPLSLVLKVNDKFQRVKEREYKVSLNSYAYKHDKEHYLDLKQAKYNNQIVPYRIHEYVNGFKTDRIIGHRLVQPSTYNSMIHNTNLTRTGWNTTLRNADAIGYRYFVIPYHPFSCEHCISHQNRIMNREEVFDLVGAVEETQGDILHPNCKCELVAIKDYSDIEKLESPFQYDFTKEEKIEIAEIRQKVNSLTLKKEEVLTDMKIAKDRGAMGEYDKYNQQRNKINKKIRELKEALPTEELRKQVVAINR
jgi:hypothetical protein